MATAQEKRIKNEFRKKAQEKPEKYYPVSVLLEKGFKRYKCEKCGNYFWSLVERSVCGDPNCIGKYEFINNARIKSLEFTEVWKKFARFFEKLGYTPIARYPVVARWRDDIFFVEASIDSFMPYVIEGVSEPPANPLVIPQFCLRFNDIDNVGVTGRHYTGFVMIGQHAFEKPSNYNPEKYLEDIYLWLVEELKIPKEEIQFHEDAWVGSGKMGPSLEYFSLGLELGNQVYMQYDISTGKIRELPLKVLDMGMGQERYVWFSHGTNTSYECVMPSVVKKIFHETGIRKTETFEKFLPYSGMLNLDEVADIDKAWKMIAKNLNLSVEALKKEVYPITSAFAIAEHTRTLLLALSDGSLPSNVGGGYNLRVILRRCLNFTEKFSWQIDFNSLFEEHAKAMKNQYPELVENLESIYEIFEVERKKFMETKRRNLSLISKLKREELTEEKIIELYDSYGIHPEELKEKFGIKIPENFYKKVTEKHVHKKESEKEISIEGNYVTEKLYYKNDKLYEFDAKVLKIIGNFVILDRTCFYPRGGGQEPDTGFISNARVLDVKLIRNFIIHEVDKPDFKEGDIVRCKVDRERRERIRMHHTAVHVLNGACRKILGNHVWQTGAYKDEKKGRLDITHYANLSDEQIETIERICNDCIEKAYTVEKLSLPRAEAEKKFGFRIYQGGAIPGGIIRILKINDFDVEACGGLHVDNTSEIGKVIILNSSKIQDGVVRIEIAAGKAADEEINRVSNIIERLKEILNVEEKELVNVVKALVKKKDILERTKKMKEKRNVEEILKNIVFERVRDVRIVVKSLDAELSILKILSRKISEDDTVLVLFGERDNSIFIACGKNAKISAKEIINKMREFFSGTGGGNESLAQGRIEEFDEEKVKIWLKEKLNSIEKE